MSRLLHYNGVLSSIVDYFCLVCEQHFLHEKDAFAHITDSCHLEKLEGVSYTDTYKEDGIRKFDAGYHCQFCNVLLPTPLHVSPHLKEDSHQLEKKKHSIHRENDVVVFDGIQIDDQSWQGIVGDTCVICNMEVDKEKHVLERKHVIKLMQCKVQFDEKKNIFRKLNDEIIQCLTCNELVFEKSTDDAHFLSIDHETKLQSKQTDLNKNGDIESLNEKIKYDSDTDESFSLVSAEIPEDNKCNTMQLVQVTNDGYETESQTSEEDNDPNAFAIRHKIVLDRKNNRSTCKMCITDFSSTMKCIKEHVSGKKHQKNLRNFKLQNKTNETRTKITFKEFITRNPVIINEYLYVDEKFCIHWHSFNVLTCMAASFIVKRCQLCEKNVGIFQIDKHMETRAHRMALEKLKVIEFPSTEFIREIRPDVFHCGFCNTLEVGDSNLSRHLISTSHGEEKNKAIFRLQQKIDEIRELRHNRRMEQLANFFFLQMLGMRSPLF